MPRTAKDPELMITNSSGGRLRSFNSVRSRGKSMVTFGYNTGFISCWRPADSYGGDEVEGGGSKI